MNDHTDYRLPKGKDCDPQDGYFAYWDARADEKGYVGGHLDEFVNVAVRRSVDAVAQPLHKLVVSLGAEGASLLGGAMRLEAVEFANPWVCGFRIFEADTDSGVLVALTIEKVRSATELARRAARHEEIRHLDAAAARASLSSFLIGEIKEDERALEIGDRYDPPKVGHPVERVRIAVYGGDDPTPIAVDYCDTFERTPADLASDGYVRGELLDCRVSPGHLADWRYSENNLRIGGYVQAVLAMSLVGNVLRTVGSGVRLEPTGHGDQKRIEAYHSSPAADITDFHPLTHFGTLRAAKHRRVDRSAGGGRMYKVSLAISNPLRVDDAEAADEAALLNAVKRGRYPMIDLGLATRQGVASALTAAGYDGMVYRNAMEDEGVDSYVILTSDQARIVDEPILDLAAELSEGGRVVADRVYENFSSGAARHLAAHAQAAVFGDGGVCGPCTIDALWELWTDTVCMDVSDTWRLVDEAISLLEANGHTDPCNTFDRRDSTYVRRFDEETATLWISNQHRHFGIVRSRLENGAASFVLGRVDRDRFGDASAIGRYEPGLRCALSATGQGTADRPALAADMMGQMDDRTLKDINTILLGIESLHYELKEDYEVQAKPLGIRRP